MKVELTQGELYSGAILGICRQHEALRKSSKDFAVSKESGYGLHCEAALAEMAVAKGLGLYFPATLNAYSKPDIPPNLQVKLRFGENDDMFVPTTCKEDELFILVTGRAPVYTIKGFCSGLEAKQYPTRAPGGFRPAHLVPQSDLHPIETIPINQEAQ